MSFPHVIGCPVGEALALEKTVQGSRYEATAATSEEELLISGLQDAREGRVKDIEEIRKSLKRNDNEQ